MNYIKTFFLLVVLTMMLVWVGGIIGGTQGATFAFIFALILNGVTYWFSDKIVLTMYRAKELPRDRFYHLYNLVSELSKNAGLPMPRIYITEHKAPNAFATGRSPEKAVLCVTRGLLELLGEEELKGVLAHELAHVKNRDTLIMTITAAIAGAIMFLAHMARWAAIFGGYSRDRRDSGNLFALLAISILAPIAALIVQLAISRSREYGADSRGARIAQSPIGLARALKKISEAAKFYRMEASPHTAHLFIINPLRGSFIVNLFSTHPPVEERIRRLQEMKI